MRFQVIAIFLGTAAMLSAQPPKQPDLDAQRQAMKKLDFLVGKWVGKATVMRGPGQSLAIEQTEEVGYRLGGLILLVGGTGRDDSGKPVFNALATISYDDRTNQYRFRAFNDGRYLDTELTLPQQGSGFIWTQPAGAAQVVYRMQLKDDGTWQEIGQLVTGGREPHKLFEMNVRRQ